MAVTRIEDLIAWQLAHQFKCEVYRVIRDSPAAQRDLRYQDQLRAAAASVEMNIAEGFFRRGPREFIRFLSIAIASLGEARLWLQDGIDRQHFQPAACGEALILAKRCCGAATRLRSSLQPFLVEEGGRVPRVPKGGKSGHRFRT